MRHEFVFLFAGFLEARVEHDQTARTLIETMTQSIDFGFVRVLNRHIIGADMKWSRAGLAINGLKLKKQS